MKKYFTFCILFLSFFAAFSQNGNIDPRISEVYGSYAPQLNPAQLQIVNKQLDRSSVVNAPYSASEQLPKLSSLHIVTKYVPSLQMETTFDPAHINPLKYTINFSLDKDQTFRIDGTDYVLLIKKKP